MKWETHCLIFMSFFSILKNYNDVFWHFGVQCMVFILQTVTKHILDKKQIIFGK